MGDRRDDATRVCVFSGEAGEKQTDVRDARARAANETQEEVSRTFVPLSPPDERRNATYRTPCCNDDPQRTRKPKTARRVVLFFFWFYARTLRNARASGSATRPASLRNARLALVCFFTKERNRFRSRFRFWRARSISGVSLSKTKSRGEARAVEFRISQIFRLGDCAATAILIGHA